MKAIVKSNMANKTVEDIYLHTNGQRLNTQSVNKSNSLRNMKKRKAQNFNSSTSEIEKFNAFEFDEETEKEVVCYFSAEEASEE